MPQPPTDRRRRRTRQLLSNALVTLLHEKPYHRITVQELVERADVGRSTFYAHCAGKDDLLVGDFEGLLERLLAASPPQEQIFPAALLFKHIYDHYALYQALVRGRAIEMLLRKSQRFLCSRLEQRLAQRPLPPGLPPPLAAAFVASSLFGLLQWWVEQQMPMPPDKLQELFDQLVTPGLRPAAAPDSTAPATDY